MTKKIPLMNNWTFCEGFDETRTAEPVEGERVHLPHQVTELPLNCFDEESYQGGFTYQKEVRLPGTGGAGGPGSWSLRFEGVMVSAEVYADGRPVGNHRGGYTPFELDLPAPADGRDSLLVTLKVDTREDPGVAPFGHVVDYLCYGGIYREVFLVFRPEVRLENFRADYRLSSPESTGKAVLRELNPRIFLNNRCGEPRQAAVRAELLTAEGKVLFRLEEEHLLPPGESVLTPSGLPDIPVRLWDTEHPVLHELRLSLTAGEVEDSLTLRIGFRDCRFTPGGFFLNGRRLQLTGLNRHQSFPYGGYAMPARAQRRDAEILKEELSLNCTRSSHYPPSTHFLDRCDELGLLVFEELPGWQFIGDDAWQDLACGMLEGMIRRDWNHPSVISWGVRINESEDHTAFYERTNRLSRELDPGRPTSGIRFREGSEFLEDIYTFNDFTHEGGERVLLDPRSATGLKEDVPYLISEYNGHMYPTKSFDQEERLVEHGLRHARVQDHARRDRRISGAVGWCAFDYNTHYQFGSGDRICYHGVMDMFRFPKPAAFLYASQVSSDTRIVLEPATRWARGERAVGMMPPYVIYTNCDAVDIRYGEESLGRFYPDRQSFPALAHPPVVIEQSLFGLWGSDWRDVHFTGILDGREAGMVSYPRNPVPAALSVRSDDLCLNSSAWDTTRVAFTMEDQAGHPLSFMDAVLSVEIEGPGEIIGESVVPLISGRRAFWVRTRPDETGTISLRGRCRDFVSPDLNIDVT